MRCPSCNKFATQSVDQNEPKVDLSVDESGLVTGSIRIVVWSECCGDELKEATFDVDIQYDGDEADLKLHQGEGHDLEAEVESVEATDEYQRNDRNGKPIKNPRYMKHLYGAALIGKIKCSCGVVLKDADFEFTDSIPSSSMDELV